jgi:glycosyltransferase involved in cell wall biosynthesis
MASGVPCLTSGGIGDVDRILEGEGVGMVLAADREDAHEFAWRTMMALAADPDVRRRCRRVAERYFSLQLATQRYDRIYAALGS